MALGTNRARNWGKEAQQEALALILNKRRVAYLVKRRTEPHLVRSGHTLELWLTPSHRGLTLPFTESVAVLTNPERGKWEALHPFDDRVIATGVSQRDVIRATIQTIWH